MVRDLDNMIIDQHLTEGVEGLHVSSVEDEEIEDYEEDDSEEPVVLGFVEKPKHKWSLLRQLFPSKAGGVPAWLDPVDLPTGRSCTCDICGSPLQFLLQVYAPLFENEKESTFHRMLYVFVCSSMSCLIQHQLKQKNHYPKKISQSVKVFRCQLPRTNPYYSSNPPKQDGTDKPSGVGAVLCYWCGSWKGVKECISCKIAQYCSDIHRTTHWSSGHEAECCRTISSLTVAGSVGSKPVQMANQRAAAFKHLWPEMEIIQENEDESESDKDSAQNKDDLDSYAPNDRLDDDSTKAFMDALEGDDDKKSWATFQERIGKAPEQVLRYCRTPGAKPLWPMASGRPSKADIPNCNHCGGDLTYEFQILPQLLYYFRVQNDADSIDWETIAVYTCQASCDGGPSYKDEFAWVQLSSQPTVKP
ncbi:hypothetical protein QQ045_012603 [Rhodiola kirilowii]